MEEFQSFRKRVLDFQVSLLKKRLTQQQQVEVENELRTDAAKILHKYQPDKEFKDIYNGEIICPQGKFEANVNLVARIKLVVSKLNPDFALDVSGGSPVRQPKAQALASPFAPAVHSVQISPSKTGVQTLFSHVEETSQPVEHRVSVHAEQVVSPPRENIVREQLLKLKSSQQDEQIKQLQSRLSVATTQAEELEKQQQDVDFEREIQRKDEEIKQLQLDLQTALARLQVAQQLSNDRFFQAQQRQLMKGSYQRALEYVKQLALDVDSIIKDPQFKAAQETARQDFHQQIKATELQAKQADASATTPAHVLSHNLKMQPTPERILASKSVQKNTARSVTQPKNQPSPAKQPARTESSARPKTYLDQFKSVEQKPAPQQPKPKADPPKTTSVQRTPIMRSIQNAKKPTLDAAIDSLLAEKVPSAKPANPFKAQPAQPAPVSRNDADVSQIPQNSSLLIAVSHLDEYVSPAAQKDAIVKDARQKAEQRIHESGAKELERQRAEQQNTITQQLYQKRDQRISEFKAQRGAQAELLRQQKDLKREEPRKKPVSNSDTAQGASQGVAKGVPRALDDISCIERKEDAGAVGDLDDLLNEIDDDVFGK